MLLHHPYAAPGDADLDLDVDHVRVKNIARSGDGYVLQAAGGIRRCDSSSPARRAAHVDLWFRPADDPGTAAELPRILDRLRAWCEDQTLLRLVAAPGKFFTLHAPDGTVLALPRRD